MKGKTALLLLTISIASGSKSFFGSDRFEKRIKSMMDGMQEDFDNMQRESSKIFDINVSDSNSINIDIQYPKKDNSVEITIGHPGIKGEMVKVSAEDSENLSAKIPTEDNSVIQLEIKKNMLSIRKERSVDQENKDEKHFSRLSTQGYSETQQMLKSPIDPDNTKVECEKNSIVFVIPLKRRGLEIPVSIK